MLLNIKLKLIERKKELAVTYTFFICLVDLAKEEEKERNILINIQQKIKSNH